MWAAIPTQYTTSPVYRLVYIVMGMVSKDRCPVPCFNASCRALQQPAAQHDEQMQEEQQQQQQELQSDMHRRQQEKLKMTLEVSTAFLGI